MAGPTGSIKTTVFSRHARTIQTRRKHLLCAIKHSIHIIACINLKYMYSSDTTKRSAIHVINTVTPWTDTIEIQDLLSDAATPTQKNRHPITQI